MICQFRVIVLILNNMYSSVVKIIHVRHFFFFFLINFVVLLISFTAELLNYHVFIGKCSSKYFSLHILKLIFILFLSLWHSVTF